MSVSRTLLPSPRLRRSTQLLSGLVLFGVSLALLVVADLGLAPWDVFHQGIARSLDLRLGGVVVVVSLLVLVLWIPLRERPGLGTLANAILVGVVFEISIGLIGETSALLGRWALLVGAIVLNAIATGMYVGAGLGPGPRDGLMTAIAARGFTIRLVRTGLEASVLVAGWLLGGSVGLGTVAFAFLIGPLVHRTLPHFTIAASTPIATGIGSGSRSDEFCSE
jgi:uncharacterized membrane protein YczE